MNGITIKKHLDEYMRQCNLTEIDAVTAGKVLDRAGLLNDSLTRPGKPLRDLLRAKKISGAYQRGTRWVIPLGSESVNSAKPADMEIVSRKYCNEDNPGSTLNELISHTLSNLNHITTGSSVKTIEEKLINGTFISVNSLNVNELKNNPGLYCIKLRAGVFFDKKFGPVRPDRIIYIGQASKSIRKRLWEQELNCISPATFFRSIGAMLGYLPPKGSLAGKDTRNYRFSSMDERKIIDWMRRSLLVNFIYLETSELNEAESYLIRKYTPLVNIKGNPSACNEIKLAREECLRYARSL